MPTAPRQHWVRHRARTEFEAARGLSCPAQAVEAVALAELQLQTLHKQSRHLGKLVELYPERFECEVRSCARACPVAHSVTFDLR